MDVFHTEGAALLIRAILSLQTDEECRAFLEDLMTGKEIQDCGQRLMVAKLLSEQMIYSRIAEATGASSATISRVNRSLNYGMGAYRIIFDRMKEDEQKQQEEPQA